MAEEISKQKIKNYLDITNSDLAQQLKGKMDRTDNWSDFKKGLISLIQKYAITPSRENRTEIDEYISKYFSLERVFAKDAITTILRDLGISERTNMPVTHQKSQKSTEYRESIHEKIGLKSPDDIVKEGEKRIAEKLSQSYKREDKGPKIIELAKFVRKTRESNKNKSKGTTKRSIRFEKFKKTIKSLYYKATASILIAPGKVPPEILKENRNLIMDSSEKLEKLIGEFERADSIVSAQNKANAKEFPDDLKETYSDMSEGKLDEEGLEKFEAALSKKKREQIKSIRESFDSLQRSKVESELRKFAKARFSEMPEAELEAEIKYAILDSKVDKDGKLVLPSRSIFQECLYDEKGEVLPEQANLVSLMSTYAESPKVSKLSNREILNLSRNYRDLGKMKKESKVYKIAQMLKEHPEMLPQDSDEIMREIDSKAREYLLTHDISKEAEFKHKIIIANEIRGQFEEIKTIVGEYDQKEADGEELNETDSKKREIALKIARKKVKSLERTGLSKLVAEGERTSKGVIKRARSVLIPTLDRARNRGNRRFTREFKTPEDPEIVD